MRHALAFSLLVAACNGGQTVVVGPPVVIKQMPTNPDLDILFVVDNSSSTQDKQTEFAASFPAFMAALDSFPGGRPNVHIGVVNTTVDIGSNDISGQEITSCPHPDLNDNGLLQAPAACHVGGSFITDLGSGDGSRVTNYAGSGSAGDLAAAMGCIANVGAAGCGFEAPMFAIQRALDGTNPANAGFLRPDADLAIVILTDEDDCSAVDPSIFGLGSADVGGLNDFRCQPMYAYDCDSPITATPGSATYTNCHPYSGSGSGHYLLDPDALAQSLAAIKDPSQTAVAVIGGPPETTIQTGNLSVDNGLSQDPALLPSCTGTDASGIEMIGRPAIRLAAFANNYGARASFHSVCQPDYAETLTDIEGTMSTMMLSPCLAPDVNPTDVDPAKPGLQLACDVEDVVDPGTPVATPQALPTCAMLSENEPDLTGERPCWWAAPDTTCNAQGGSTLALHVERAVSAPDGTLVRASCVTHP